MNAAGLAMRKAPRLGFVTHTSHRRPFVGVCENEAVNIGVLIIDTSVFVVENGDHSLVLDQSFLHQGPVSQQYRSDGVFGHLTGATNSHTVMFSTLDGQDKTNRDRDDLFL